MKRLLHRLRVTCHEYPVFLHQRRSREIDVTQTCFTSMW
jgi:hypothetical protein